MKLISIKLLRRLATCALMFALFVVMLGAYTRLTNAGLGCPDWPGCYGHIVLPSSEKALGQAQTAFPQIPIESSKAWTEMAHRYAAGTLVALVLSMAFCVTYLRRKGVRVACGIPLILLVLIAFQAALGMWTVTLKLLPIVVMGHLLGGILIFACLSYFFWQLSLVRRTDLPNVRAFIGLGILIVFCQIALGGWVSSNYAGIACIGFPRCNGQWLPVLHFSKAFNLFSSIGANYQGGLLDNDSRVTIQFVHRLGAYVTATYVLLLSVFIGLRVKAKTPRIMAAFTIVIVLMQFSLGVINVMYLLPLWAAVAHNGLAALLLASMVSQYYLASKGATDAH